MEDNIAKTESLQALLKEKTAYNLAAIEELVKFIGGEEALIDDVLPLPMTNPAEARQDAAEPDWTQEQVNHARELAHQFGYGAEQNVPSGLTRAVVIIEGGLAWKVAAEYSASNDEDQPITLAFAGSPHRPLKEEEFKYISEKLGLSTDGLRTEFDFVQSFAESKVSQVAERPLPFGYGVEEGNPAITEVTGQLKILGRTEVGQEVLVIRIDREEYEEEGQPKYRYQPTSEVLMRLMSDVLYASGDNDSPVSLVTSNAYASRIPNALQAGLRHGREFGVAMYGRATLAEVQGTPLKPDTPLNQLPGELRVMRDKLQALLVDIDY